MRLTIFGAQSIALGTLNAMKIISPGEHVECFLVTNSADNPMTLAGLRVVSLGDFSSNLSNEEKNKIKVMIATPENVMAEIEKSLDEEGLFNHVRIDSLKWAKMQEEAFNVSGDFAPLASFPVGASKPVISVFKMFHSKDKKLQNAYDEPDYMIPLRVGAAGDTDSETESDQGNEGLLDNSGDNISIRNGNYCELTGLYWMWKNHMPANAGKDDYFGLAHYRRRLELPDEDLRRLLENEIDVVLPYPMPCEPDISVHHKRYISDEKWSAVMQALRELAPEYAKAWEKIERQQNMYNYNIILAKRDVLDDYCNWLFPILFRIEEIYNPKGDKAPDRYIGYVGETLETLYFMHNRDKLKIAHAGCRFLV